MTNGTRIDPEVREPRAIKIKTQKRKGKKIALIILSVLLVIAIGGGIFAFVNFGDYFEFDQFGKTAEKSDTDEEPSEPEVPPENVSEPETPEKPESLPEVPVVEDPIIEENPIPREEWFMVLVNAQNPIPEDYNIETVSVDAKGHLVDARIAEDLLAMIAAGESEGLDFVIHTAFRSYEKQKEFYEAGKTGAAPGTSEHNSGLAIDIGCARGEFEGSPEEAWLLEHAHEYGFILRYPADKVDITGFAYEPWHFRYVGKEQALLIKESELCLEEYLAQ